MRKRWLTSHIQTSKVISSSLVIKKRNKRGRGGGHYPSTIIHCYSSWVWGIHNKIWLRQQRKCKYVSTIYDLFNTRFCISFKELLFSLYYSSIFNDLKYVIILSYRILCIHSRIAYSISRITPKQRSINNIIRSQCIFSVAGNMNLVSNFKRNLFSMQDFQT